MSTVVEEVDWANSDIVKRFIQIIQKYDQVEMRSEPVFAYGPDVEPILIIKFEIWPELKDKSHLLNIPTIEPKLNPDDCPDCFGKGYIRSPYPPYDRYWCETCNGKGKKK